MQYTNPAAYPPLEHSSRLLANAGWQVMFLGTGAQSAADNLRFPAHPGIVVRQMAFCPAGWRQKLHFLGFCFWVLAWTLIWRPRWVYASEPSSCPISLLLTFFPGVQVIYHEHDTPELALGSAFQRWVYSTRRALLRRAAICIWPNRERVALFARERQDSLCVWNCPRQEEVGPPRSMPDPGHLVVYYHGSINANRLPISVIQAMARLPAGVVLQVAGYEAMGGMGHVQLLREEAERLGIGARCQFFGTEVLRSALFDHCRRADVGLIFLCAPSQDVNQRHMTGASNKPFDYLACGLALLVSDLPDWRKMFADPGYALACNQDDPESIAATLRWFLDHPAGVREMGERGRQRVLQEWNYETQFRPVIERISRE